MSLVETLVYVNTQLICSNDSSIYFKSMWHFPEIFLLRFPHKLLKQYVLDVRESIILWAKGMSKTYNEIYSQQPTSVSTYPQYHWTSSDIARQTSSLLTFATKTTIIAADTEMRLQAPTSKRRKHPATNRKYNRSLTSPVIWETLLQAISIPNTYESYPFGILIIIIMMFVKPWVTEVWRRHTWKHYVQWTI